MKAFEVPYGSKIKITDETVIVPVAAPKLNTGDIVTMIRYDGAYCKVKNESNEMVYIHVGTEVEITN